MAFPVNSGSERLKYSRIDGLTNADQALITGVALHIYTVVSIIFCEMGGASGKKIRMKLTDSSGNNPTFMLYDQDIGNSETFVWNDRFSFDGDLQLEVVSEPAANIDVLCTYIDQDWT